MPGVLSMAFRPRRQTPGIDGRTRCPSNPGTPDSNLNVSDLRGGTA